MRRLLTLVLYYLCACLAWCEPLPRGHVFFQTTNVVVETATVTSFVLPVELMRGYTVRGSANVKAENVSAKPNPWNGIKFMLAIETTDHKLWPQAPLDVGTFDWKPAGFTTRIPTNATKVVLCLGLEEVTGKVEFDAIKISAFNPPVVMPAPVAGPMFKGHTVPRLRGAMVGPDIDEEGLRVFGQDWGANLIRWQIVRYGPPDKPLPMDDYDQWLDGELRQLDVVLALCEKYGLMVVVDLHSPSGSVATDTRLFTDRKIQNKFVEVWRRIATRYKNAKTIWGYDIANEPVEEFVADDCDDWHALAERTGKAIRAIDPARAIICEASPWDGPDSLAEFTPIAVSNVVYSAHMYVPHEFTHQGVYKHIAKTLNYPGMINGEMWDKAALEKALQPVVDFQKRYNVHIYIGEFSAIRWAPDDSAYRYLKDCIEIFENHGWDWSYHAFREWDGWSVEHDSDPKDHRPSATPTTREKLLQLWFATNQKP